MRAQANQTPVTQRRYAVNASMAIPGMAATSSRTAAGRASEARDALSESLFQRV